jgi:hypothetical protein
MANPILGAIFKNPMIEQIFVWQVLQGLVQALEGPLIAEIQQSTFTKFPSLASSPDQLAAGVVRGHLEGVDVFTEAKKSGYDKGPFQLLIDNAGQPLPLEALLEAWRRGIITKAGTGAANTSLEQGIRESDLKNKWTAIVEQLQWQLANPGVVVEGWLRAQLSEADARAILKQNGIDDATATLMYKTAGRPPSPQELQELYHRGLIPRDGTGPDALSLQQGFLETDLKNKWWSVWTHLGDYLPPPRTVTAMIREGALTDAQGADYFKKAGLDPTLSASYLAAAHHQKTAATKELAKGDILALYSDGFIDGPQAITWLGQLGWPAVDAQFELDIADFRRHKALLDGAVTKIKTLYIARKIDAAGASDALGKLGLSPNGISQLFAVWNVERGALVVRLTAAQWAAAVKNGWITSDQGLSQLEGMGYSPFEAWVYLSDALKAPATSAMPPADIPASYTQGP